MDSFSKTFLLIFISDYYKNAFSGLDLKVEREVARHMEEYHEDNSRSLIC